MRKAMVLLSGGIDSCTSAGIAVRELGSENVMGFSIKYGQRASVELQGAKKIAKKLGIPHVVQDVGALWGDSTKLTNDMAELPDAEYRTFKGTAPTNVMNRNMLLISLASVRAFREGYNEVWIGVHGDDMENDLYPDCRNDFVGALGSALYIGSANTMKLMAPLQYMRKDEIVRKAMEVGAPLEYTYSCYNGGTLHCGACPSCRHRRESFEKARVKDPTTYEARE